MSKLGSATATDGPEFLLSNCFPNLPLSFPRKRGKGGKTSNVSIVWNFSEGKIVGRFRTPRSGEKKKENKEVQNIARKNKSGKLDKRSLDKNGPC